ncbi:hypothetical protein CLV79_10925 [Limimaricola soesokkakensis]|uniref:Uncharacterized protein n=1 Tax=Limimaricola soesokkakensis TaxID=1343159 RepID=A0A1X6ZRX9_9RHOB|nr:hypothetical protein CLV79_10925 [Limimaricola soesokkakensis]SLN59773.1 hypothetical protein LOS8367_02873 [Limimaricola soesokkakensis]
MPVHHLVSPTLKNLATLREAQSIYAKADALHAGGNELIAKMTCLTLDDIPGLVAITRRRSR